MRERVIVIGGGPAGLIAAGRAAEVGADVLLLEKTAGLGNKLRLTGNRRCNLTNRRGVDGFAAHLVPDGSFLRNAFARFFAPDLVRLLANLGVPTMTDPDGRVFPASQDAGDVLDALVRYCSGHGVRIRHETPAARIVMNDGAVQAVVTRDGTSLETRRVVLATGGLSYPQTGSSGDGYLLAGHLGHTIVPVRPGLVPLVASDEWIPRLQGISLPRVRATAERDGQVIATTEGELLFTHYGVTGPVILSLSLYAAEALHSGRLCLSLDLAPGLSQDDLRQRLRGALARSGKAGYHTLIRGLLPRALADVVVEHSGIPGDHRLAHLTATQVALTHRQLRRLELTVVATRPMREAMVTIGGVSLAEIDPMTMGSRRVRGLYFAGEVIDVAGDTGGYNLQVAFTTGYVAGESATQPT